MRKQIRATKKFVSDHKVAIAVTATSIVWYSLVRRNLNVQNEFLKEHDLFDEFWAMPEEV